MFNATDTSPTITMQNVYGLQIGTLCNVRQQTMEMFVVVSVLICTALVGNCMLMYIMANNYRTQRGQKGFTSVQILITYNCLADLLFVLFTLTPQLVMICGHLQSHRSRTLCKLQQFVAPLPMVASSSLLVAISIDRFQVRFAIGGMN